MKGDYKAKEERVLKYLKIIQRLSQYFDNVDFVQIPRAKNAKVDFLARLPHQTTTMQPSNYV